MTLLGLWPLGVALLLGGASGCVAASDTEKQEGVGGLNSGGRDADGLGGRVPGGGSGLGGRSAAGTGGGTPVESCDEGLTLDDADPLAAAKAMGLCSAEDLRAARYTLANGQERPKSVQHGLLSSFGVVGPREGTRLLALSSGTARAKGQPGWINPNPLTNPTGDMNTETEPPRGFPVAAPDCPGDRDEWTRAYDGAALELELSAPTTAKGFSFDFTFYTVEFPAWVCDEHNYNDFFVVLMDPAPPGSVNGNLSFDLHSFPIGVNNAMVEVCDKAQANGSKYSCPRGPGELRGTGYEGHAATGWLTTKVAVTPGARFRLRFALWDSGDHVWDSTVLIDHFRWEMDEVRSVPETRPSPH